MLAYRKQHLYSIVKPKTMQKEPTETHQGLTLGQDDLRTILLHLFLGIPRNQEYDKECLSSSLNSLSPQCRQASATKQSISHLKFAFELGPLCHSWPQQIFSSIITKDHTINLPVLLSTVTTTIHRVGNTITNQIF